MDAKFCQIRARLSLVISSKFLCGTPYIAALNVCNGVTKMPESIREYNELWPKLELRVRRECRYIR